MKKTGAFIIVSMIFLLASCSLLKSGRSDSSDAKSKETKYSVPIVNYGREVPKEKTIIYVKSETTEVFGDNAAKKMHAVLRIHNIATDIIDDFDDIPTYETEYFGGSCFSIAPHYAITNAHVVNDGVLDSVQIAIDGTLYDAEIARISIDADIALLYIPDYAFPFSFDLQNEDAYSLADPVYVIGYPITDLLNLDPRVTQGIINARSGFDGNPREVQISAQIQPGNSGGPLLKSNDFSNVVGIASSSVSDITTLKTKGAVMQNVNFAIKSMVIGQSFPETIDIDAEENAYPSDFEEATKATAYVYCKYTPICPYNKRLVVVSDISSSKKQMGNIYYSWYKYFSHIIMKFIDIDTGEVDSSLVETYDNFTSVDYAFTLLKALDDYIHYVYGDDYYITDALGRVEL